jgi:2-dehydropantoate 2-reductase
MRTLVVGAGAVGGYFGGRLLEAGRDVTFLARPARAAALAETGLRIRSPHGDATLLTPPAVLAGNLHETFDLVLLSCKAFDLEGAIASFAPAVGPQTAILPLLNGMRHLDSLDQRFGTTRVLGGQCQIASTLTEAGEIVHLSEMQSLTFGERDGAISERVKAIESLMSGAIFESRASTGILLEMWEKWVFLASLAGSTCLMRATIGEICQSPGGADFVLGLLAECGSISAAEGYPVREAFLTRTRGLLTATGSPLTASMFRDMERNAPIEADHILGDLLQRRGLRPQVSLLDVAYTHLKAYELRRR